MVLGATCWIENANTSDILNWSGPSRVTSQVAWRRRVSARHLRVLEDDECSKETLENGLEVRRAVLGELDKRKHLLAGLAFRRLRRGLRRCRAFGGSFRLRFGEVSDSDSNDVVRGDLSYVARDKDLAPLELKPCGLTDVGLGTFEVANTRQLHQEAVVTQNLYDRLAKACAVDSTLNGAFEGSPSVRA